MQHPDEGTIHSWLDGALSADEAARVEAHVKECPQCAAAVAEARGFIAASSRILTALDNAPGGVIPVAAPKKRVDPLVWRIAATVMIVAAGTLVVVRNQGGNERSMSAVTASSPSGAQTGVVATNAVSPPAEAGSGKPEAGSAKIGSSKKVAQNPSRPGVSARDNAASPEVAAERADQRAVSGVASAEGAEGALASAPAAPTATRSLNRAVEMDAAADLPPLKVVGTPRRIGAKVTLYEVAPGDTVTLTESVPLSLQSVVVTGAAGGAVQATGKAMAPALKTRGAAPTAAAAPTVAAGTVNGINTIVWTDPTTGSTLTLSGRMLESRLQQVKTVIERERAAAAAAKKNP